MPLPSGNAPTGHVHLTSRLGRAGELQIVGFAMLPKLGSVGIEGPEDDCFTQLADSHFRMVVLGSNSKLGTAQSSHSLKFSWARQPSPGSMAHLCCPRNRHSLLHIYRSGRFAQMYLDMLSA